MNQTCQANSKNLITSSESLGWEGIMITHNRTETGLILDNFAISDHQICMIVGHQVTWEGGNNKRMRTFTTYPGQLGIYPAHQPTFRRIPPATEFVTLILSSEKLQRGLREGVLPQPVEFALQYNVDDLQLQGLIQTLLAEAKAGNPNGRLFVESLTLALSIHFIKQYAREPEPTDIPSNLNARQLRRALDYIEDNLIEEISLETLASEIGFSKYYFSRLFKQTTGQTPYQYVLQRRLERAKALLQQGSITIIAAAHLFGFSDQSHFSRLFKKSYGMTPGGFLKNAADVRN